MKGKGTIISDERNVNAFTVVLKLEAGGPEVARERVTSEDMRELCGEVWLDHLRNGKPDLRFEDLFISLLPVHPKGEGRRCEGFIVQATGPDGATKRRLFTIHSMAHVAERATKRLVGMGVLSADQTYYYEVVSGENESPPPPPASSPLLPGGHFTVNRRPLDYKTVPLPPLIEKSRPVGQVEGWVPILYSYDLFLKMERHARRGARSNPPVESGAVIFGSLCSCPDTGEFFVAATDSIELTSVKQSCYSLSLTGKTWARIQNVVKARQSDPTHHAARLVGQCHGHNFLPGARLHDGKDCESCPTLDSCDLTSVFVSTNDQLWTRSVFTKQPWAFCHIFGLDARGNPFHAQFGFRGSQLVRRGFHLVPDLGTELERSSGAGPGAEIVHLEKEEG